MTLPSLVLGLLCSLLIGTLFHLCVDGGSGRLLLYLILSLIGFAAAQWIATSRGWVLLPVGSLDLGVATIGSLICLGLGYWLGRSRARSEGADDGL